DIACVATKAEVGRMRTLVSVTLTRWGLSQSVYDACLIASELVTNAVENAQGGEIRVRLRWESGGVLLGVWDSSDEMPVVHALAEITLADVTPDCRRHVKTDPQATAEI